MRSIKRHIVYSLKLLLVKKYCPYKQMNEIDHHQVLDIIWHHSYTFEYIQFQAYIYQFINLGDRECMALAILINIFIAIMKYITISKLY